MQNNSSYLPMMQFTRGDIVESVHFGACVVVRGDGRITASYADPQAMTYMRSSSKPLQVIGLIENGGVETFGLTQEEISVMCGSHSATPRHIEVVKSIHEKIDAQESDMLCGTHYPLDKDVAMEMIRQGKKPTQYHHNCSGKHSSMLAYCKLMGWDFENYIAVEHPLQKAILATFADMVQMSVNSISLGVDGCSVPVFGVPIYNAAWGFARMANSENVGMDEKRAEACVIVREAMMAFPTMVSGPGRFDTDLMEVTKGRIFGKGGAEGFQGMGILPYEYGKTGLGVAVKISDGDLTNRAVPAGSLKILQSLLAIDESDLEKLEKYGLEIPVKNWVKTVVGKGSPCFDLEFYE